MHCRQCHKRIADGAAYCAYCGAVQRSPARRWSVLGLGLLLSTALVGGGGYLLQSTVSPGAVGSVPTVANPVALPSELATIGATVVVLAPSPTRSLEPTLLPTSIATASSLPRATWTSEPTPLPPTPTPVPPPTPNVAATVKAQEQATVKAQERATARVQAAQRTAAAHAQLATAHIAATQTQEVSVFDIGGTWTGSTDQGANFHFLVLRDDKGFYIRSLSTIIKQYNIVSGQCPAQIPVSNFQLDLNYIVDRDFEVRINHSFNIETDVYGLKGIFNTNKIASGAFYIDFYFDSEGRPIYFKDIIPDTSCHITASLGWSVTKS